MEAMHTVWTPPVFDCSKRPDTKWSSQLSPDPSFSYNFARVAKWCSDGSAALAQCENRSFEVLNVPPEYTAGPSTPSQQRVFKQPSPILDFSWFPAASSKDPATFCYVASVRECPVKLLDAEDGRLRASYKIVDHRERFIAPHSLAFNMTAARLYCGFEDAIEVFDVQRPGEGTRLHVTPSKKSHDGLKGIISSLAFANDASSAVYAAGTLNPSAPSSSNIALFSEDTGEVPVMFVGAESPSPRAGFGIRASVTQLMFNPVYPYLLYASFRRHDTIYEWDLRSNAHVVARSFRRSSSFGSEQREREEGTTAAATNQKLRFDIDISGQLLGVGDQLGGISIFNLMTGDATSGSLHSDQGISAPQPGPAMQYDAHNDAVGSVAFHPLHPYLLSVSGSRHFHQPAHEADSTDSSSDSGEGDDHDQGAQSEDEPTFVKTHKVVKVKRRRPQPLTVDASVKLWSFGANASGHRETEMDGSDDHTT